jgi:hypothetical protein
MIDDVLFRRTDGWMEFAQALSLKRQQMSVLTHILIYCLIPKETKRLEGLHRYLPKYGSSKSYSTHQLHTLQVAPTFKIRALKLPS